MCVLYTVIASVIHHVGAKIVLVDCNKDDKFMDLKALEDAITEKLKVMDLVDLAENHVNMMGNI